MDVPQANIRFMFLVITVAGQQPERGRIGQLPSQTFKKKLKTPKRFSFLRKSRTCNHFSPLKLSAGCRSEPQWLASNGYAAQMLHLGKTVYSQEMTLTWSSMKNPWNNLFFRPNDKNLNWTFLSQLDYKPGFARNHLSEITLCRLGRMQPKPVGHFLLLHCVRLSLPIVMPSLP